MKKILLALLMTVLTSFFSTQAFARCQYWGPPINQYRCLPDKPGQESQGNKGEGTAGKTQPGGGISSLNLIISCGASGSAVDWINTASLDCGDGNRYDALAVQKDKTTLGAYFKQVPPGKSCEVTVSSGFDSKVVGRVATKGSKSQTLSGKCAW